MKNLTEEQSRLRTYFENRFYSLKFSFWKKHGRNATATEIKELMNEELAKHSSTEYQEACTFGMIRGYITGRKSLVPAEAFFSKMRELYEREIPDETLFKSLISNMFEMGEVKYIESTGEVIFP